MIEFLHYLIIRSLNNGNFGVFLIMGTAGFISSAVGVMDERVWAGRLVGWLALPQARDHVQAGTPWRAVFCIVGPEWLPILLLECSSNHQDMRYPDIPIIKP